MASYKVGNLEINIEGDEAIQRMADRLGRAFTTKELNQAYRFAVGEVVSQMKRNVKKDHDRPWTSGNLLYSINAQPVTNLRKHKVPGIIAGPLFKNRKGARPYNRHLVEMGTKPHTIRARKGPVMPVYKKGELLGYFPSIQHPGSRPYRPFSRAIEAKRDGAMARLRTKLGKIMDKEIKKK